MPLRDFRCLTCGNVSEHLVKLDESDAPTKCTHTKDDECKHKRVANGSDADHLGRAGMFCQDCDVRLVLDGERFRAATDSCRGDLVRVEGIARTSFELRGGGWAADRYGNVR